MVTIGKIGGQYYTPISEISGLSTDDKPTVTINGYPIVNGSTFKEIDTGNIYMFSEEAKKWYSHTSAVNNGGGLTITDDGDGNATIA